MTGVYIFDGVLLAICIVLCIVNRIDRSKVPAKWKIDLGYVFPILSIVAGVIQQLLTFLVSIFIMSLADGNSFAFEALINIMFLMLLPLAIIVSAIVCIVKTKKLDKYRKSLYIR